MRLLSISLENYRNIEAGSLNFKKNRIFFLGANGQGKTNLLEAIGLSASLRSFRKAGMEGLVRLEQKQSRIFYKFHDHDENEHQVLLQFGQKGKKILELDGEEIKRFANYLGEFPSVAFSSRDFRLVRDGPSERRKWLDLVLSSSSKEYFEALRLYHRSLRERNAILKRGGGDKELDAFEKSLISSAFQVFQIRLKSLPTLSSYLTKYYHKLSDGVEEAGFKYRPDLNPENEEDLTARILEERSKDRQFGTTRRGPHRDDFEFVLQDKDARTFSSEGQQKGLVLGLRFSEFEYLKNSLGKTPLLLIDDVLGELDEKRKANFKKLLPAEAQVFATGTTYPESWEKETWECYQVECGNFTKL